VLDVNLPDGSGSRRVPRDPRASRHAGDAVHGARQREMVRPRLGRRYLTSPSARARCWRGCARRCGAPARRAPATLARATWLDVERQAVSVAGGSGAPDQPGVPFAARAGGQRWRALSPSN
jgi:hypothetical protein